MKKLGYIILSVFLFLFGIVLSFSILKTVLEFVLIDANWQDFPDAYLLGEIAGTFIIAIFFIWLAYFSFKKAIWSIKKANIGLSNSSAKDDILDQF